MLTTHVCRVLRSFNNLRLCHAFSRLSEEAQRAIWACRIIKEISEAKEETDYFEDINGKKTIKLSLADTIKGLTLKSVECAQDQLDDEIRVDVLKMFTTGTILNYNVFQQKRVSDAVKPFATQEQFIFYPNILVTKFMFNQIIVKTKREKLFLLYGNYGISKTVSIILFHTLSSIVNQYFYKTRFTQMEMKELNSLMERKLIQPIPKIFYYSSDKSIEEQEFVNIIKQQCTQTLLIKQDYEKLQQITSKDQFAKIKRLYLNRGIKIMVAFDQLNAVASIFRKYNTELLERKFTEKEFSELKYQLSQAQQQVIRITRLQKLGRIFFNSSADIEIQLLKKQVDTKSQYTLDLEGHSKVDYLELPYNKSINTRWGQVSLSHCIWFQIYQKLVAQSISADTINKMQLMYYQKVANKKDRWPSYLRFLHIRETIFPRDQSILSSFKQVNQDNFIEKLQQGMIQMLRKSQKAFLEKILTFLQKGTIADNQRKFKLINILHRYSNENSDQTNKPLRISLKQLQKQIRQPIQSFLQQKKLGIELFSLYFEKVQKQTFVVFSFSPADLIKFSTYLLYNFVKKNLSFVHDFQKFVMWDPPSFGKYVEFCCLEMLMKRYAKIWLTFQTPYKAQSVLIKVQLVIKFLHFLVKRKIWNNFTHLLQAAAKQEGQYFIGVPAVIDDAVKTVDDDIDLLSLSKNSPSFDVAIVRCVNKFFYIDTLDFTIETKISQMKSRVKKAASLLQVITRENNQIPQTSQIDEKIEEQQKNILNEQHLKADKKYPTFVEVKQNKNFVVRHTIVCPKSILNTAKISQIEDELAWKKHNNHINYNEEKEKAQQLIANILQVDKDYARVKEKEIQGTLTYTDSLGRWSICYSSLEDIKNQDQANMPALTLKALLNLKFSKK